MTEGEHKLYRLLKCFKSEYDLSKIYDLTLTEYEEYDDVYFILMDKRNDSVFFESSITDYDKFITYLDELCEEGSPSYKDFRMFRDDFMKIIREVNLSCILD